MPNRRVRKRKILGGINKLNLNNLPGKQVGVPFPIRRGQQCVISGVEGEIRKSEECIVELNTEVLQWHQRNRRRNQQALNR